MSLDIESWDDEDIERFEEHLSILVPVHNMSPDDVINAIQRDAKIRDHNQNNPSGGRPNKIERHFQHIRKLLVESNQDVDPEAFKEELMDTFNNALEDLSERSEYNLRRKIENELLGKDSNISLKKPLYRLEKDDLDEWIILRDKIQAEAQ